MKREHWILVGALSLILIAASIVSTWLVMRRAPVVETPAAEVRQSDGSVVLARQPDAKAKPKQIIPKGATLERTVSVTVRPKDEACAPVTCDLSLVRYGDGSRRVVASSPDGDIVGGVDIPVDTAAAPEPVKVWAAGLSIDPAHKTPGFWVERDIGRVRVGVDVNQVRLNPAGPSHVEARLRVGVTF